MFAIEDLKKKLFNKEKIKEIVSDKENVNSFLIALLIMSGLISFIINLNNIIPFIILTTAIIIEIVNYKDTRQRLKSGKFRIQDIFIVFFTITMIVFTISIINNGLRQTIIDRFVYFSILIVIPFFCIRHDIEMNKIINSILIISGILAIPLLFANFGKYDGGIRMSISYYMLPTYIAIIMYFFINKKNNKDKGLKANIIKYLIFALLYYPYILFLIRYSSRGIILSIIVCIVLCLLLNKEKKGRLKMLAILAIIGVIEIILFKPIMICTNSILESFNIKVGFISKTIKLIEENKFDNGREKVYNRTIEGIKEHPIIGNGIGDYAEKYGTYPHNLLLQAWYEGGFFYFLIHLGIVIYSLYILLFKEDMEKEKKYLLILFISISMVRLMLSYEFWKEITYGFYLYIVFDTMQEAFNRRSIIKNGNNNNSDIQES